MKVFVQMNYAKSVIASYDGSKPLSMHLKHFFSTHKQMGSKDRKFLQHLVYSYFRLNKAIVKESLEEKIIIAHQICNVHEDEFLSFWKAEKNIDIKEQEQEKIIEACIESGYLASLQYQFPVFDAISEQIDKKLFIANHLNQPYTWIRCKKKKLQAVIDELNHQKIAFHTSEFLPNAIGFSTKINFEDLQSHQKGFFEVQDLSSQQTAYFYNAQTKEYWWDCCAASGGKSLALKDMEPTVQLTVSDMRASILQNLQTRFQKAHIQDYEMLPINLEIDSIPFNNYFDAIIADVPCTGSGTWGRNPERMSFLKEEEIQTFSQKQLNILQQIIPALKSNGKIIYSTCSVYKNENEAVVESFCQKNNFRIEVMQYLKGYHYHADTMFVAVMKRAY